MSVGRAYRHIPAETFNDLKNPAFSSFLDMTRWMAAFLVFVGHLRNPLFLSYGDLSAAERSLPVLAWYFVTGWFGEAVIVFFVLSGYLVGGITLAKRSTSRFDPGRYAIDRISRLYVAFFPAVLLTLILDLLGSHLLGGAGLYNGSQLMITEKLSHLPAFDDNITLRNFFGTVFMMQTFQVTPFGSNQPLWTISCEFWFYVVFGLVVTASIRGSGTHRHRRKIICGVLIVAVFLLLGISFPYYLSLWLIGVAVSLVHRGKWRLQIPSVLLFLILLTAIRIFTPQLEGLPYYIEGRNYVVALSFALVLYAMRGTQAQWLTSLARVNCWMASFSFSLYLIHFPLMLFLLSALYATGHFPEIRDGYGPTDASGLVIYIGVILVTLMCAWLFATITERHTGRVRNTLQKQMHRLA